MSSLERILKKVQVMDGTGKQSEPVIPVGDLDRLDFVLSRYYLRKLHIDTELVGKCFHCVALYDREDIIAQCTRCQTGLCYRCQEKKPTFFTKCRHCKNLFCVGEKMIKCDLCERQFCGDKVCRRIYQLNADNCTTCGQAASWKACQKCLGGRDPEEPQPTCLCCAKAY